MDLRRLVAFNDLGDMTLIKNCAKTIIVPFYVCRPRDYTVFSMSHFL